MQSLKRPRPTRNIQQIDTNRERNTKNPTQPNQNDFTINKTKEPKSKFIVNNQTMHATKGRKPPLKRGKINKKKTDIREKKNEGGRGKPRCGVDLRRGKEMRTE